MKFKQFLREMANIVPVTKSSPESLSYEANRLYNSLPYYKIIKTFNNGNRLFFNSRSSEDIYILTDKKNMPLLSIEVKNVDFYTTVQWVEKVHDKCTTSDIIECYFTIAHRSKNKSLMCDKLQSLGGKYIWKNFTREAISQGFKVGSYNHHSKEVEYVYNKKDYKSFDEWYKVTEKYTYTVNPSMESKDVKYTLFIKV